MEDEGSVEGSEPVVPGTMREVTGPDGKINLTTEQAKAISDKAQNWTVTGTAELARKVVEKLHGLNLKPVHPDRS